MTIIRVQRYFPLLGKVLIWVGVLVWAPFIVASLSGKQASILPYLAIHLPCILAGTWLKKQYKEDGDVEPVTRVSLQKKISNLLIGIGIAIWLPYLLVKNLLNPDLVILPFLIVHLSGIIGGTLIRLIPLKKVRNSFRISFFDEMR